MKQYTNGNFIYLRKKVFSVFSGNMITNNGKVVKFTKKFYKNIETINLKNDIVLPSFINAHIHLGETLYGPLPSKMSVIEYLNYTESINKNLSSNVKEFWQKSAEITLNQSLCSGVSVINTIRSNNYKSDIKIKSVSGYPIMNSKKLKEYHLKGLESYKQYCLECTSKNITPCVFIHSFYSINKKCLDTALKCIKFNNSLCTIHGYEDEESENNVLKKWNKSTIQLLKENKLLNNKTILVHGCTLSLDELNEISKNKVNIVICPLSNINLNEKYINPKILINKKINWSIGSDGLATGESADLLDQALVLAKEGIDYLEILKALTINPQKALHIKNEVLSQKSKVNFVVFGNENFKHIENKDIINILHDIFLKKIKRKAVYFDDILIKES